MQGFVRRQSFGRRQGFVRMAVIPAALRQLFLSGPFLASLGRRPHPRPRSRPRPGRRPGRVAASASAPAPGGRLGTGLPVPRYVSLKTDRVNLREGPSKDHRTAWVYQRAGLPVEIIAEYETWRRIRDSEGTEGWVLHSLLSGRRTALVQPWGKDTAVPAPPRRPGREGRASWPSSSPASWRA